MSKPAYVHIVDNNVNRRAQIARTLYTHRIHAEIYESLEELTSQSPKAGALLICEDVGDVALEDALTSLRDQSGYMPFAVFSECPSPQKIVRAMSSGALDYFEWPCGPHELIESVHRVCHVGEAKARAENLRSDARRAVAKLSPRERDVLRLIVSGLSNKASAKALGISPRTVEIHRANMMAALNAGSVADAVRIGLYAEVDPEAPPLP